MIEKYTNIQEGHEGHLERRKQCRRARRFMGHGTMMYFEGHGHSIIKVSNELLKCGDNVQGTFRTSYETAGLLSLFKS